MTHTIHKRENWKGKPNQNVKTFALWKTVKEMVHSWNRLGQNICKPNIQQRTILKNSQNLTIKNQAVKLKMVW